MANAATGQARAAAAPTVGEAIAIATTVLAREGLYLDRRQWPEWLALYHPQCLYWVPAWRDEHEETRDPASEVSLIYHDNRLGLEDRVLRIGSRKSITAMPLPRTAHFTSNILASTVGDEAIEAEASWAVHVYHPRTAKQVVHFGRYELQLVRSGDEWLIARKIVHLQNDRIPTVLDFYSL